MPKSRRHAAKRANRRRISIVVALLFAVGGASTVTALAYAAHVENNDAFCASCHTQPETLYYQRSLAQPVDLASVHTTKGVECIQCHSGRGATGRVTAMASVALPDLVAFLSGHYRRPAVVTVPIGDDHCLKCHGDIESRMDFNNHFHAFLPQWQALMPGQAATCIDCHQSHVTDGLPDTVFLKESTTLAVCQACHASLRG